MKIIQAINRLDALIFNTYEQSDKVEWLSRLDSMVKKQIIDTHEGADEVTFTGYDDNTDKQTELLVPAPHDEIYLRWLEAQIHYHNGEYDKYNNAIIMFNTAYEAYQAYYTRNHLPVIRGRRFLF
jgi:trehalose utilization protein